MTSRAHACVPVAARGGRDRRAASPPSLQRVSDGFLAGLAAFRRRNLSFALGTRPGCGSAFVHFSSRTLNQGSQFALNLGDFTSYALELCRYIVNCVEQVQWHLSRRVVALLFLQAVTIAVRRVLLSPQ